MSIALLQNRSLLQLTGRLESISVSAGWGAMRIPSSVTILIDTIQTIVLDLGLVAKLSFWFCPEIVVTTGFFLKRSMESLTTWVLLFR